MVAIGGAGSRESAWVVGSVSACVVISLLGCVARVLL